MRKSTMVSLVLLGAAAGCSGEQQEQRRDYYQSLSDCKTDWGETKCEPDSQRGGYLGPLYWFAMGRFMGGGGAGLHPGGARANSHVSTGALRAAPSSSFFGGSPGTSRGGFGSTGRSFSGGGGGG